MAFVFWLSAAAVLYPYLGYPILLWLLGRRERHAPSPTGSLPRVSMIVPVCNEEARIERKLANTAALRYPEELLQVIFVSDGSVDRTVELLRRSATRNMMVVDLPERRGKAAGLNAGLALAAHDIVVFSDAAIALEPDALLQVVAPFADSGIGCVSGEDRIAESGGEAWYGRYELLLRRLESQVHSIVGASGSFYAQRRALCAPFTPGQAPDFLSVLRTVEQGSRAISAPLAVGMMTSTSRPKAEFERKVRTLIRGLTTLSAHAHLLNPVRFGTFSFILFSHKVLRWAAPLFMLLAFVAPLFRLDSGLFMAVFVAQAVVYAIALGAWTAVAGLDRTLPGRAALYFCLVNAAVLVAIVQFARGARQELWTPTQR